MGRRKRQQTGRVGPHTDRGWEGMTELRLSVDANTDADSTETCDEKSSENMAASALLTLLSSPSLKKNAEKNHWGLPLKRQKSDPSLTKWRAALRKQQKKAEEEEPEPAEEVISLPSEQRNVEQVVASAMNGAPVEPAKVAEASRWLYRRVELVRGKYKGRHACVVGMTAKKYRVRVIGVEHQLEFYPSMFRNPQLIEGLCFASADAAAASAGKPTTPKQQAANKGVVDSIPPSPAAGRDTEGSSSSADTRSGSDGSSGGLGAMNGDSNCMTPKTKEQLLKLMEETSAEMRRAKSMLVQYQEARHEVD